MPFTLWILSVWFYIWREKRVFRDKGIWPLGEVKRWDDTLAFEPHLGQGSRAEGKNAGKGQLWDAEAQGPHWAGLRRGPAPRGSGEGRRPGTQETVSAPWWSPKANPSDTGTLVFSGWSTLSTVGAGPSGAAARKGHGKSRTEGDHVPLLTILATDTKKLILLKKHWLLPQAWEVIGAGGTWDASAFVLCPPVLLWLRHPFDSARHGRH